MPQTIRIGQCLGRVIYRPHYFAIGDNRFYRNDIRNVYRWKNDIELRVNDGHWNRFIIYQDKSYLFDVIDNVRNQPINAPPYIDNMDSQVIIYFGADWNKVMLGQSK